MAELSSTSWSETDASNNVTPPSGWPGGMNGSQVEPAARANMGAIKRSWNRQNPQQSTTGSAGAYVWTPANLSFPTAYAQGEIYSFKANFTSVGADTLNINGLGALGIYKTTGGGAVAITAGDIVSGGMYAVAYDSALNGGGGGFQLLTPPSASSVVPAGVIWSFGGTVAPAGWLIMDNSAVSRTTYAALFAAIGTSFGSGDGSTTFNIGDGRGRVLAGKDPTNTTGRLTGLTGGVSAAAIGNNGGEQAHALATAELAVHAHGVTDPTHNHGVGDPGHGHGVTDPTHAHGIADPGHGHGVNDPTHVHPYTFIAGGAGSFITYTPGGGGLDESIPNTFAAATGISIQGSGTGIGVSGAFSNISVNGAGTGIFLGASGSGISIQNAGSGTAHNTVQPTLIVNHIIKF